MRLVKDRPERAPFCLDLLNTYKCKYCLFETTLKVCLHRHLQSRHQNKQNLRKIVRHYKCDCNFSTYSAFVLASHKESCNDVSFHCTQCSYYAGVKSNLERHIRKRHKSVQNRVLMEATSDSLADNESRCKRVEFNCSIMPEAYTCKHCAFTNCLKIVVMNHTSVYHEERTVESLTKPLLGRYKCEYCDFLTYSELVLFNHKFRTCKQCRPIVKKAEVVEKLHRKSKISKSKPFKCDQCDFGAKYRASFKKHMLNRHKVMVEDLQCELCSYRCERIHLLKSHFLKKHTNIDEATKRFANRYCPYVSKYKRSLKAHVLRKHSYVDGDIYVVITT